VPATFAVSYGDPQTVEVDAKRELGNVRVRYQINGGATKSADTAEWKGGKRFGGEGVYFHRLRGVVSGAKPGDKVKVWFESLKAGKQSEAFTYTLQFDTGNRVLILSAEDYGGIIPNASSIAGPRYLDQYEKALEADGVPYDVYDVDGHGRTAPDRLGVLAHYKAVIWYTGDDQLVREAEHRARPVRPSWPTTRSSTSAPSSTRAANCSTPGRTRPPRSWRATRTTRPGSRRTVRREAR
jgi:hypothetical protein